MKRILVYSSLSVLTAIGTVFTAANAEIFEGEETSTTATSQLASSSTIFDTSATFDTADIIGADIIGQVPGTVESDIPPAAKPSAATPTETELEVATAATDSDAPGGTGVETLTPVPGATPLSPIPDSGPVNGIVPATPVETPLGSPTLPAAPGTTPLESEAESTGDPTEELAEELEAPTEGIETDGMENDAFEGNSFEATPTEAPLEEPAAAPLTEDEPLQDGAVKEEETPNPAPPGSNFTPSAPDSNFTPSEPNGITPSAPSGVPSNGLTPIEPDSVTPSDEPPVDSPLPAEPLPAEPLPAEPDAPSEALPPIDDSGFDEAAPLGSTSDRLIGEGFSPFQLSYLAIGGGLKEAGIPGGNQLLSAYKSGELSAEDIVAAGAMTKRLGTDADDEADYTKGVDKFLQLLSRDSLNS